MSYQYSNNWPYSQTTFPTMEDHVDPVNNAFFTGLNLEIVNIEFFLGYLPQGAYANVRARLDAFDAWLTDLQGLFDTRTPGYWEGQDFVFGISEFTIVQDNKGWSVSGFNYYNLVYSAPCERGSGSRAIAVFNTTTDLWVWQDVASVNQPRGAVAVGDTAYISISGSPGDILKFNILTWGEIPVALNAGSNFPGEIIRLGDYIYFPCYTTPARLVRMKISDDGLTDYDMNGGENEVRRICTDGTYIWFCCNTDPVKLIKFNPGTGGHTTYTLTGFNNEVDFMCYYDGIIYMFSNDGTSQFCKFDIANVQYMRFTPDWGIGFHAGYLWEDKILVSIKTAAGYDLGILDLSNWVFYVTNGIPNAFDIKWIIVNADHAVWSQDLDGKQWAEGTIADPTP